MVLKDPEARFCREMRLCSRQTRRPSLRTLPGFRPCECAYSPKIRGGRGTSDICIRTTGIREQVRCCVKARNEDAFVSISVRVAFSHRGKNGGGEVGTRPGAPAACGEARAQEARPAPVSPTVFR